MIDIQTYCVTFINYKAKEEAKTKSDSPEAKSLTIENSERSESSHLVEGDSKIFSKTWDEYDQKFKKITSDEHRGEKRLTNLNELEHNYFLASNVTLQVCQICPIPFSELAPQRCKNTFGLFNTNRGESEIAMYSVTYGVKCVNGVRINSTLLNTLAEIQRQKVFTKNINDI
ncbi:hypothetical protein RF11_03414 [Thelohanellus kitauei]|uniref:Uncharacterized protein n=1 Tax=Thelohanellus kitauei TaxID=669202 RepID=A0A0C2J933_THEKT|nr:hypothetical protein RF11_03414 [Thelohanellus kitauei]